MITWHKKYPGDWKQNWFEIEKKWSNDIACADGIFVPFNIDAKVNAAYVVLGLLYGQGDFTKTLDIATRAGQDADCNPSSAAGILGTILGYDKIPAFWKMGLKEIEDINFKYTTISLNKVYDIGFRHALKNVEANKGTISGNDVKIALQQPAAVKVEKGFPEIFPVDKINVDNDLDNGDLTFEFEGTGFILSGDAMKREMRREDYIFTGELYIDGEKVETAISRTSFVSRLLELFWNDESAS